MMDSRGLTGIEWKINAPKAFMKFNKALKCFIIFKNQL